MLPRQSEQGVKKNVAFRIRETWAIHHLSVLGQMDQHCCQIEIAALSGCYEEETRSHTQSTHYHHIHLGEPDK